MRFEEERVACSMVRGEKNSKRPPLAPLGVGMDYSVGRALRHARFGGGIMARGWREFATCFIVASPQRRRLEVRSPGIPFPSISLHAVIRIGLLEVGQKLEIFQNKIGFKDCEWSSLNAPGTETPLSYPNWKLQEFPFSHY